MHQPQVLKRKMKSRSNKGYKQYKFSPLTWIFCRSLVLTSSLVDGRSSENVVNGILGETTPSTCENGSSMKETQQKGTELSFADMPNSNIPEQFSDSFVQWVNGGQMLCH
ncbi:phosphoinositide phosphatase SAC3-like [Gossypium australe]|uniref:Phosphoinositide phosphatase SAC3-like n=1 Tax=Gossypium australe TaxID=47621 RepID=A0A5B6WZ30_9ROSI|nr:phosphoinositide phosphatase SAC3-like [Gossypium australe]